MYHGRTISQHPIASFIDAPYTVRYIYTHWILSRKGERKKERMNNVRIRARGRDKLNCCGDTVSCKSADHKEFFSRHPLMYFNIFCQILLDGMKFIFFYFRLVGKWQFMWHAVDLWHAVFTATIRNDWNKIWAAVLFMKGRFSVFLMEYLEDMGKLPI